MKSYQNYTLLITFFSLFVFACGKDPVDPEPESDDLEIVTVIQDNGNQIELYTVDGKLRDGYNEIFLQIKNQEGTLIDGGNLSWYPEMQMTSMRHSCPFSEVSKVEGQSHLYKGYVVFQMASNTSEYWEMTVNYSLNGTQRSAKSRIEVDLSERRTISTFQGSDQVRYILALVEPSDPKVAQNIMTALLFKPQSSGHSGHRLSEAPAETSGYALADGFKIKIDPRMPGMNNHSSPNNKDLSQAAAGGIYEGVLSLTMTGYWKVNLQVENAHGEVIKGEAVTGSNESSSIFFEIEF